MGSHDDTGELGTEATPASMRRVGEWTTHGSQPVYKSEWVELWLDDVEPQSGDRHLHHALRFPKESVYGLLVRDSRLLMLWRHRVVPNTWGWEVPAGWVDPGETAEFAVVRETEVETGWRARQAQLLASYNALSGISDMRMHVFELSDATLTGPPEDHDESAVIRWVPVNSLRRMIENRAIVDGHTLLAVTLLLIAGRL